ncbi:MAG: YtxH domain-containing protein [Deltaproteobacteria bacterium]|nr:YtxH domain-containing protein [Deltaproteobacteria bacterium]
MHAPNVDSLFHRFGYAPLRSNRSELFRAFGYIALGAVAGAVIVALVTPKSGPQLRSSLSDTAGHLKDRAGSMRGRIGNKARDAADELRNTVDAAGDRL